MIKLLFGSLVVIFIASYVFRTLHTTPSFSESKLPAQTVLYLEHKGDIQNMAPFFKIVSQTLKEEGTFFTNAKIGVIYNDNPLVLLDRGSARVLIGIFVSPLDRDLAVELQKKFSEYKLEDLPEINTIKSTTKFSTPQYSEMVDFAKNNFEVIQEQPIVIDFYIGSKPDTVGETETHVLYGQGIPRWLLAKNPQSVKK